MANTHVYGIRFFRSISGGGDCPQVITSPIATAYAPVTVFGAGTPCNLNIGDPIRYLVDGTVILAQAGQATDGTDNGDYVSGVVVGFPRVTVGGAVRPGSFYASGTAYTGGIGSDTATLVAWIPAEGNIFEIDAAAVVGAGTKNAALAVVGGTAQITYSVLTSGIGQPKANPLMGTPVTNSAQVNQLRIVGLGKKNDAMDFTAVNVAFQVMFNEILARPSVAAGGSPGASQFVP